MDEIAADYGLARTAEGLSHAALLRAFINLHQLMKRTLAGDRVECPFCKSAFERFLPFSEDTEVVRKFEIIGAGFRPNARCPECLSLDRERLVYLYLERAGLLSVSGCRILHIAPERCLGKRLRLDSRLRYVAGDLDRNSGRVTLELDLQYLPFQNDSFNLVVCNHVLEHIPDDRRALAEITRVLDRSGAAILQTPVSAALESTYEDWSMTTGDQRKAAFGQSDHVRIYGADYAARLEQSGLRVQVFDALEEFGADLIERHALIARERIFIGRKRA
jgi:SAM-dependent methyltransferase